MDRFQDITINDASLKALFISYFLNGQYSQAFNLITNNTQLNTKAFVANVMNEIAGILSSLQENFNDEVILYLENQLSGFQIIIDNYLLKNDYDGSTEYQIYNFVIYNDLIYMYINSDPSTGNLPTDTDYWVEIGLLGQKGEPGIGVNLRYTWDSSVTYNPLDVVYYNNELWVATIQNTNVTPGTETTWQTLTGSIVTVDNPGNYYVGDLVVDINPVQDLHGYDNPWPAGGGKNKAFKSLSGGSIGGTGNIGTSTSYDAAIAKIEQGKTYTVSTNDSQLVCAFYEEEPYIGINASYNSSRLVQASKTFLAPITGFIAFRVLTGYSTYQCEEGPTATAYAPYSNICPISGWTGANVTRTGKNLFDKDDPSLVLHAYISAGKIFYHNNSLTVFIPCKANTTYTVTKTAGQMFTVAYTQTVPATGVTCYSGEQSTVSASQITIKTGPNAKYLAAWVYNSNYDTGITGEEMIASVQITVGSTATTYEPYTGTTIPISFGSAGTVYGGTLDVTTGVLTVDRAMVDLGTLTWYLENNQSYPGLFYTNLQSRKEGGLIFGICSAYPFTTGSPNGFPADKTFNFLAYHNAKNLYIRDSSYSTAAEFKAAMSGVQLVYELATPQTYQLTPQEVQLLAGENNENNIWADTGNIEVEIVERDWEEFLEFSKASLYIDSTSPSSPFEGMIWFDTSLT